MNTFDAILTRRSVRKYREQPIAPELLDKLLRAGMYAPSAVNKQPWHFVVVDDRDLLARLPTVHPYAQMATRAACAIVVCGDLNVAHGPAYIAQDCAAATQNILLAAHDAGLGAVWCGIHGQADRESGFRSLFALPEGILPFALIVLGYPDEQPAQPERFKPERVHHNHW